MATAERNPASSVLIDPGVAHGVIQWCRNPGRGCQHTEGVFVTEEGTIKTLIHLRLAGWQELDAFVHWKQLEEQQVATRQTIRSLLTERQPLLCLGARKHLSIVFKALILLLGGLEPFVLLPPSARREDDHGLGTKLGTYMEKEPPLGRPPPIPRLY
ncbi:hypothetical protein AOLI_G00202860 [Acnodon oligacanthus]